MIQSASQNPVTPPASESKMLSVRSWRTSRKRLAPMASRIAISLLRSPARASNSPATLMQVIKRTRATAAIRIQVKLTTEFRRSGMMKPVGVSLTLCPSFVSGYSLASCWASRLREASAFLAVTSLFRRPTAKKFPTWRLSSHCPPGSTHSSMDAGTHNSGV